MEKLNKIDEMLIEIDEIIQKEEEKLKQSRLKLFYEVFFDSEPSIELMLGPLKVSGGLEHRIVEKISEKFKIKVKEYDFNFGKWTEPSMYMPVFSTTLAGSECKIEDEINKLFEAYQELQKAIEHILEEYFEIEEV